jgi:hypothetical protein
MKTKLYAVSNLVGLLSGLIGGLLLFYSLTPKASNYKLVEKNDHDVAICLNDKVVATGYGGPLRVTDETCPERNNAERCGGNRSRPSCIRKLGHGPYHCWLPAAIASGIGSILFMIREPVDPSRRKVIIYSGTDTLAAKPTRAEPQFAGEPL